MTSIYSPEVKIFYGSLNNDHRLIPAPMISITKNNTYSNDTIIGYSYTVTLSGSATGFDLRDVNGQYDPNNYDYNFGNVIDHMHIIRKILSQNGNILNVIDSDNNFLLKAKGGILRSLSFDQSENNWRHFANYTAEIEFHSIEFIGANLSAYELENCADIHLKDGSYSDTNDDGIANIQKFKIKSFEDSWSITFNDQEAFSRLIKRDDNITTLDIDNRSFNIEYNISAVGKHHFVYDNEMTNLSKLLPAWEQAKNFVQYRLYYQVTNLINGILKNTASNGCDTASTETPQTAYVPGLSSDGLLKDIGDSDYKIYNETISCDVSESDGSFSATYSAIVKKQQNNKDFSISDAIHTITKTRTIDNSNNKQTINLTINGSITGLIEGGLVNSPEPIQLPSTGSILIYQNNNTTKYDNALILLSKIYQETDYNNGLGMTGKRDLKKIFKDKLGITMADLGLGSPVGDPVLDPPHPSSFNLTHDYNAGTINYTVEYSSESAPCGKKYQQYTIQTTEPTKVIAVFNIPRSFTGPLIQSLGTKTNKIVTVNIQGVDQSLSGKPRPMNIISELNCNANYLPITLPVINGLLIDQQYSKNILDGSYTINLTYICNNLGCNI